MFVIVFDFVNVLPVLTKLLLLPPLCVQLKSVRLFNAQLHLGDFVGLSSRQIGLGQNAGFLQLKKPDAVRQMQLISLY